jgi:hypothetical protein
MASNKQPCREDNNNKQEKNKATREIYVHVRAILAQAAALEMIRCKRMDGSSHMHGCPHKQHH